jgi:predicted O-methyltransferase YrrM
MQMLKLYWWRIVSYLQWYAKAQNAHGLHSPYVFKLYNTVISGKNYKAKLFPNELKPIENLRKVLLAQSNTVVEVTDFGTGGHANPYRKVALPKLVAMTTPKRQGWFMYNLLRFLNPKTVLELGTNLGMGTAYFQSALGANAHVYTIEGCPNISEWAQSNFNHLGKKNITRIVGNLDTLLAQELQCIAAPDFVYFDANHAYLPTIDYFELCLSVKKDNTVFLFDDLRYSPEMLKAWHYIQNHPSVQVTIDLFDQGIVLFEPTMSKQKFYLKP